MNTDLKPCPFCGGKAKLKGENPSNGMYHVACLECDVETPYHDKHDAIFAWNRRHKAQYDFPVGVGDKLYDLLFDNHEWEVTQIDIYKDMVVFRLGNEGTESYSAVHLKEIGERQFLTLEEAQKAYKRHEAKLK